MRSSPVQVGTLPFSNIVAGSNSTMAIDPYGTLVGWGNNLYGKLGTDTLINTLYSWSKISNGSGHSVALRNDGTLYIWGQNNNGQLGSGDVVNRPSPVQLPGSWINISAGGFYNLAIKSNNTLWGWGINSSGELGDGTTVNKSSPVQIAGSWNSIWTGTNHNAVVNMTGTLFTWGLNNFGQLGLGDTINRSSPVQVGTSSWSQLSGGASHTMGITVTGSLFTWGSNVNGELGDSTSINKSSPVLIGTSSWSLVSAGHSHSTAITTDNKLFTWGNNTTGQLGFNCFSFIMVKAGLSTSSVIRQDSLLWTTGNNTYGQLGDGTTVNKSSFVQVPGFYTTTSSILARTFAISTTGALFAWGYNLLGELGLNDVVHRSSPVQVGTSSWTMVVTGGATDFLDLSNLHTFAIRSDGILFAWGRNPSGQLGINDTVLPKSSPIQVGSSSWSMVTAGLNFALGITVNGKLFAWGNNKNGQLGVTPSTFTWSKVDVGNGHSLFLRNDNKLFATGQNASGQLGSRDSSSGSKNSPVFVASGSFTQISAGLSNSYAITSDGRLLAWGDNTVGQIPTISQSRSNPVQVASGSVYSMYFNGTTDFLIPSNPINQFQFGTGNFSIEGWVYPTNITTDNYIISFSSAGADPHFGVNIFNGNWRVGKFNTYLITASASNRQNVWSYFTLIRSGNSLYFLVNGVVVNTLNVSSITFDCSGIARIGTYALGGSGYFAGYISNLRVTSTNLGFDGSTPISIPTTNLTSIANTVLLTCQDASYKDNTANTTNILTPYGTPRPDTLIVPYTQSYKYDSWNLISASKFSNFVLATRTDGKLFGWGDNTNAVTGAPHSFVRPVISPVQIGTSSWSQISAGASHSLAIDSTGRLFGWGFNSNGQLTIGSSFSWTSVFSGDPFSSFAIRSDGLLFAWGSPNTSGIFGTYNISVTTSSPIQLNSFSWKSITSGKNFSLMIRGDNTLWGTGNNDGGTLGLGDTVNRSSPVQVGALSNWASVSAGNSTVLALKTDSTLWAWGLNTAFGNLGLGDTINRSSPVQIGTSSWSKINAGSSFSAAIRSDGGLYTWGFNTNGQLGSATTVHRSSPLQVGSSSWTQVVCGISAMAAITNLGQLFTWGSGSLGELGDNTATTVSRSSPVQVGTSSWITVAAANQIAVSAGNILAITSTNSLWAWGLNGSGQLGDGTTVAKSSMVQVTSIPGASWLSVSTGVTSLGILTLGQNNRMLFAWGQGTNGAIGNNALTNRSTPVQIGATINTLFYSPTQITTSSYSQVSAGQNHTLAITSPGTLFSWGRNDAGQLGITAGINNISLSLQGIVLQRSDGTAAVAGVGIFGQLLDGTTLATSARSNPVQLGTYYSNNIDTWRKLVVYNQAYSGFIGIKKDGTLWAWGTNANGQLGDNSTITRSSPVQIGSSTWLDISAGVDHVVGVQTNGTLWSWGVNNNGQVGDNTTITRSSPVQLTAVSASFVSVSAGKSTAFVIDNLNRLYAWGFGGSATLGQNDTINRSNPTQIAGSWVQISASSNVALGLKSDRILWAWGTNTSGGSGDGTTISRSSPIQVSINSWLMVATLSQDAGVAGIQVNNTLWTWGNTTNGTLGTGAATVARSSPVQVGTSSWTFIAGGETQFAARTISNTIFAWGINTVSGTLGDGTTTNKTAPTAVILPANISSTIPDMSSPVQLTALSWKQVSAGSSHSLALTTGNFAYAWGLNTSGQLGLTNATNRSAPVQISSYSATTTNAITLSGSNYLTGPSSVNLLTTGPFTIEAFINPAALDRYIFANAHWDIGQNGGFYIGLSNGALTLTVSTGTYNANSTILTSINLVSANVYSHIAITRDSSNVIRMFINGAQDSATTTYATSLSLNTSGTPNTIRIGTWVGDGVAYGLFIGSISNLRIVQGVAVYTSTFTPPNSALSLTQSASGNIAAITTGQTVLLACQNISPIVETAGPYTLTNTGAVTAPSATPFITVFSANSISASLDSSGTTSSQMIYNFGLNTTGQLGDSTFTSKSFITPVGTFVSNIEYSPIQVGTSSWISVSAGLGQQTLAINSENQLFAWGFNNSGQLGLGDTINRSSPVQVGTSSWSQISAGNSHTMGITISNFLYAWGGNPQGQLGDDTLVSKSSPIQIGLSSWTQISASAFNSFGITSDTSIYTWGSGSAGQLGDNTITGKSSPVLIGSLSLPAMSSPTQVGTLSYSIVSAGLNFTYALSSANKLFAWGLNDSGQTGTNILINRSSPVQLSSSSYTLVNAGYSHATFVLNSNPQLLLGTGENTSNQLGDFTVISRSSPVQVAASTNFTYFNSPIQVSSGNYSAYYKNSPVQVGTSSWSQISAGGTHTLAINNAGLLFAWGLNNIGQLGISSLINNSSPVQVGTSSWSQVSAGDTHNIIAKNDGTINTFGNNNYGQLGDGT